MHFDVPISNHSMLFENQVRLNERIYLRKSLGSAKLHTQTATKKRKIKIEASPSKRHIVFSERVDKCSSRIKRLAVRHNNFMLMSQPSTVAKSLELKGHLSKAQDNCLFRQPAVNLEEFLFATSSSNKA